MKILAFSDLHRDTGVAHSLIEASTDADVIVAAGDFATKGVGARETLNILKAAVKPTVLVSGNHDRLADLREFCHGWPLGHLLHGDGITIDGLPFFGLGGEIPHGNLTNGSEGLSEDEAAPMLGNCPAGAVLVTHSPPFGHADKQVDGAHEGSTAILAAIEQKTPRLVLCGHIHAAWGQSSRIGGTTVHNLGPTANWFDL